MPIDGIGIEGHLIVGEVPSTIQQNIEQFVALGVKVSINELDIRMTLPSTVRISNSTMLTIFSTQRIRLSPLSWPNKKRTTRPSSLLAKPLKAASVSHFGTTPTNTHGFRPHSPGRAPHALGIKCVMPLITVILHTKSFKPELGQKTGSQRHSCWAHFLKESIGGSLGLNMSCIL